jgi:hypothetical protein
MLLSLFELNIPARPTTTLSAATSRKALTNLVPIFIFANIMTVSFDGAKFYAARAAMVISPAMRNTARPGG